MAALSELVAHARETRRQTAALRSETSRLTRQAAATRRAHAEQRRRYTATVTRAEFNRTHLPAWPAWGAPTADLRSTLVPLE